MFRTRLLVAATAVALVSLVGGVAALANVPLTQISSDSFNARTPGQHRTEVEPDTFASGSTIVSAFQVGRFNNGGATWSSSTQLAGPMSLSWLPTTTQGVMVGDYISTSFAGGPAHGVIAVASPPSSHTGLFDQAMFTPTGVSVSGGTTSSTADAIVSTGSDHPARTTPPTAQ